MLWMGAEPILCGINNCEKKCNSFLAFVVICLVIIGVVSWIVYDLVNRVSVMGELTDLASVG